MELGRLPLEWSSSSDHFSPCCNATDQLRCGGQWSWSFLLSILLIVCWKWSGIVLYDLHLQITCLITATDQLRCSGQWSWSILLSILLIICWKWSGVVLNDLHLSSFSLWNLNWSAGTRCDFLSWTLFYLEKRGRGYIMVAKNVTWFISKTLLILLSSSFFFFSQFSSVLVEFHFVPDYFVFCLLNLLCVSIFSHKGHLEYHLNLKTGDKWNSDIKLYCRIWRRTDIMINN